MKRNKFLLSLLLLLVGVVSASAQTFTVSDAPANGAFAGNTNWYYIHSGGGNYWGVDGTFVDANGNLTTHSAAPDKLDATSQWCIVGNETSGYKFYNRQMGTDYVLGVSGSEANARTKMYNAGEVPTGVATTFWRHDSGKGTGWNSFRIAETGNNYFNYRGDYLALWNSSWAHGNDDGSAFEFVEIPAAEPADLEGMASKLAEFRSAYDLIPVGTQMGCATQAAKDAVNTALTALSSALEAETPDAATAGQKCLDADAAVSQLSQQTVGYGERYLIKNVGGNVYAHYNSGAARSEADPTIVLTTWGDYNRNSFYFLDIVENGSEYYYAIRSAVDQTKYIYAINTGNENSNVGVKDIPAGTTVPDDAKWKITVQDDAWNIIPKGGEYSWNPRGNHAGNNHVGQWGPGYNAVGTNKWRIQTIEEHILYEKVTPYEDSEGKIGGVVSLSATTETAKALAATLRSSFTDANLTAYKNFVPAWKTPANGLYKVYNKGINKYLFSESSDNTKNITLINDGGDNAKYYWKVSFNGNAATIMGSTGLSMAKGNTSASYANATTNYISPVNMQPAQGDAVWTEGYFLLPNVHSTEQNKFTKNNADYASATNPYFLTTWTTTTGANQYAFEPVTLSGGAEIYTVEMIGAEGSLTYNDAEYEGNATVYNGGFYVLTSKPSAGDFTASTVSGYTPEVAINGNSITVTYAINDGVKLYSPKARASALKTDGTKYMIYNATSNDDRYGMYHNNGSNNIQKSGVHPSGVKTLNDAYLFTLEAEMNEGTATGKYYIKSVSGNTYFNINGTINNSTGQALNIKEYSTSTHKPGTDNFTGDNGGTTVGAAAITSDQKFWAVELDNVGSNAGCWNGNPDTYAQWETSHALAFYEVEEMDANTELADEIALLDEVLSKTGVGYPAQNVRKTLAAAITAAQNSVNAPAAYTAAINTYKNSTDIELPENGKAYVFVNVPKATGRPKRYINGNSNPLVELPSDIKTVPASGVFVARKLENGDYVFVNNEGKYLKRNGAGTSYETDANGSWNDITIGRLTKSKVVGTGDNGYVSATSNADLFGLCYVRARRHANGNDACVIVKSENGNYDNSDEPYYSDTYSSGFQLVEVSYSNTPKLNEATIDNDAMTLGTFSAPFPTVIPEGVKAFYVEGVNGTTATLKRIQGEAIPANTGVILTAETGTASAVMVPATTETVATVSGNMLVATSNADFTPGENVYVLGAKDGVVAFYKGATSYTTLGKNKAYLQLSEGAAPALIMSFGNGEATGIEGVEAAPAAQEGAIFDLSGRRVLNPTKGLYIIGGKKVYIK